MEDETRLSGETTDLTYLWRRLTTTLVTALLAASLFPGSAVAAEPPSGTVGPSQREFPWTGPPRDTSISLVDESPDDFCLTVDVPWNYWDTHDGNVELVITWEDETDDFAVDVFETHDCTSSGELAGFSESRPPGTSEKVIIPEPFGKYRVRVHYHAVTESGYSGTATFFSEPTRTGPPVIFDTKPLEFAPATVVSAHFLGTEPMVTMERRLFTSHGGDSSRPGAIDPNRIFVDWPLSSRTEVGQLSRSTDGGDSFRLLFDPLCAQRSRPNCFTGGGGDTVTDVNLVDGTLFYADQEFFLGHEGLASSTDHGDSFPVMRQHVITNPTGITDRQWLASAGNAVTTTETATVPATELGAFLAYRQGVGRFYVQGIRASDGSPLPQSVPQREDVLRSGPLRVDTTGGPGRGWLYQPYTTGNSTVTVATAHGAKYQDPSAWDVPETPLWDDVSFLFPWLELDSHGNAYMVWIAGSEPASPEIGNVGFVMYSASDIDHPENNPNICNPECGRPGSKWTDPARVSPLKEDCRSCPDITSAVFSEVVAGEEGQIAISYLGTSDHIGASDFADSSTWDAYAAVISNAHQAGGQPAIVTTGRVSHRPVHRNRICTGGFGCTGPGADRSLADMIDIGVDQSGRVGVVYGDNNSGFGTQVSSSTNPDEAARPFAHFAKQVSGPSLFGGQNISVTVPSDGSVDAVADATWPNQEGGALLRSLDARSLSVQAEGTEVVARLDLADARLMAEDLAAYNAAKGKDGTGNMTDYPDAERLQYIVRIVTDTDIYHLSGRSLGDGGPLSFFGGVLGPNDTMRNPDGYILGSAYKRDPGFEVQGTLQGDTIELRAPLSALGLEAGGPIYSVTAFTTAGPRAEDESLIDPMRTIDATPPFDAVLLAATQPSPTPAAVDTTVAFSDDTASEGQYTDDAMIGAQLLDEAGAPIAGQELTFALTGEHHSDSWTAVTGADGFASATRELTGRPGTYNLTVHYPGAEDTYGSSSNQMSFVILREDTGLSLELSQATGSGRNKTRTVTATLEEDGGGVGGKTLIFFCDGTQIGTADTDADGVAVSQAPHNCAKGDHLYEVVFEGDDFFIDSQAAERSDPSGRGGGN